MVVLDLNSINVVYTPISVEEPVFRGNYMNHILYSKPSLEKNCNSDNLGSEGQSSPPAPFLRQQVESLSCSENI
jgi:hypothetical protein